MLAKKTSLLKREYYGLESVTHTTTHRHTHRHTQAHTNTKTHTGVKGEAGGVGSAGPATASCPASCLQHTHAHICAHTHRRAPTQVLTLEATLRSYEGHEQAGRGDSAVGGGRPKSTVVLTHQLMQKQSELEQVGKKKGNVCCLLCAVCAGLCAVYCVLCCVRAVSCELFVVVHTVLVSLGREGGAAAAGGHGPDEQGVDPLQEYTP